MTNALQVKNQLLPSTRASICLCDAFAGRWCLRHKPQANCMEAAVLDKQAVHLKIGEGKKQTQ